MPIISEGYASTKIQGGTRGKTKVEENPVQMKANVIEQAQVEEISSTKQVDSLYKNSKGEDANPMTWGYGAQGFLMGGDMDPIFCMDKLGTHRVILGHFMSFCPNYLGGLPQ